MKSNASWLSKALAAGRDAMLHGPTTFKVRDSQSVHQASEMVVNYQGAGDLTPGQQLVVNLLQQHDEHDRLALSIAQGILDRIPK